MLLVGPTVVKMVVDEAKSHRWLENSMGCCSESAFPVKCCVIEPRYFLENCKSVMVVSNLLLSA